jgi:hypothetical protein
LNYQTPAEFAKTCRSAEEMGLRGSQGKDQEVPAKKGAIGKE